MLDSRSLLVLHVKHSSVSMSPILPPGDHKVITDVSSLQEWIKDTQNVAPLNKMEDGELECAPEDAVVVQPAEAEMPKTVLMTSPLYPQTGEEEATGDFSQLPRQPPQGRGVVSLGDFTFVMSDNSYMML